MLNDLNQSICSDENSLLEGEAFLGTIRVNLFSFYSMPYRGRNGDDESILSEVLPLVTT